MSPLDSQPVCREPLHVSTKNSISSHTYATQLLLNGVNPKVVSELLGHSSITVTLDIYGHVFPRNKQEAVAALPFGQGRTEQKGHSWGTGQNSNSQLRLAQ